MRGGELGQLSQQTRHVDPILGSFWPSVVDGETTLAQHWVNVTCLLGYHRANTYSCQQQMLTNVGLMLCRRRWTNTEARFAQHLFFMGYDIITTLITDCSDINI